MNIDEIASAAKNASIELAAVKSEDKNKALAVISAALKNNIEEISKAKMDTFEMDSITFSLYNKSLTSLIILVFVGTGHCCLPVDSRIGRETLHIAIRIETLFYCTLCV